VVHGVAALVTSATGDEGASQRVVQIIRHRRSRHFFNAIVVRGRLPRSARRTTDQSKCASRLLCISANVRPNRVTNGWTERQLFPLAVVQTA